MPVASIKEISAARRLDNVRYAIRDLAVMADDLVRQGKKILYLNVGDPNIYDFKTPAHLVEAVAKAMRDNKNGYAPSPGIPEAVEAIRNEAVRKGISSVQDVFVTSGASEARGCLPHCSDESGRKHPYAAAGLPSLFRCALQIGE